ncbi:tubulin-specific chaperone E [Bombyx mori]|uniref:Tubulin-specific chaperone E n=1 Tax=Bombyx mori TaxID=7091 RepID=A0A8R2AG12_BOMMO|nr:tubulin-specific chaperone E [Bombyx mori]
MSKVFVQEISLFSFQQNILIFEPAKIMVGAMPVNLLPKFCNGAMDSCNGVDGNDNNVYIGSRVKCNDDFGTVRYIGEVQGYKGLWYGIEWDNESRGKHDGCLDGIQYFKTSKPSAGSFVRPNKIIPSKTCAEAIRQYYGDPEDETLAAHRRTIINEWKREMGAPFIEMVGFEKIHQKQKFDRLLEVCVHDQNVSRAGDVSSLCPNVRSLDVSRNLFSNWREVIQLSAQLPDLRDLDVSKNRMLIDAPTEILAQLSINFSKLEKINLSVCDYTWTDILKLSHLWPKIHEIIAAYNRIDEIEPPLVTLRSLSVLRLDGNPITSWSEVMNLGALNLKVLSLNDCLIAEIRFGDDWNQRVETFKNLEILFLNRNRINDWRSISELNKLSSLKKLYFLKNPIQTTEDYDTGSQLVVAKIGTLQELNGSIITGELRRGAEYDYLKRYGGEWKVAQLDFEAKAAFDAEHCRFEELIRKYGIPEDSLLVKLPKITTLTSQLLEVTLRDENGKSFKKKFPSTMAVQKLITLSQRLFSRAGNTGTPRLYVLDEQMDGAEIYLDNSMKDLAYYSIKNGDVILVKFR